MTKNTFSRTLTAATAGVLLSAGMAIAAPVYSTSCSGVSTAIQCLSNPNVKSGGNVKVEEMNEVATKGKNQIDTDGDGDFGGVFDMLGWMEIDSIGSTSGSGTQDGDNSLLSLNYSSGNQGGSWTLATDYIFDTTSSYALSLKGSNTSVVYLLDNTKNSGTWNVGDLVNNGGNNPDLSNLRLFGKADLTDNPPPSVVPSPSAVPLPAGGVLLLSGLAGLGLLRRRKRG